MLKHNLQSWDRTLVWHAFTQMAEYEPFVIERAEGCVLVDIDGRQYIDGVSSLWCNIHGHRHPKIDAAVRAQLEKVAHVTNLGGSNPTTILLAKRLIDIAPPGLRPRVLFRRRRYGRRGGHQDGLSILAAATRSAAGEDMLRGAGRCLSRRYAGQRERGRRGAVSCHVPPAAVRDAALAGPRQLPHAAGRSSPKTSASIIWRNWSRCWPSTIGGSPLW